MREHMQVDPLRIAIDQSALDDLRQRLMRVRWPDAADGAAWEYGANPAFMRTVVDHWRDAFDWRAQERALNAFPQFRAKIDGVGVHLVHVRGVGPNPLPLMLTHGWPSSFLEMLPLVPLLTDPARFGGDPADAFDVVIPSIPGYGFSDRITKPGFTYREIADLWVRLMEGLGYPRFGAHSYDVGASIMGLVLRRHPERVIGYHTTEPGNPRAWFGAGAPPLSAAEQAYAAYQAQWEADEGGYMALQTTRPQTVAYALNDSPVGLAAWILEKWHAWTDPPSGDLLQAFALDDLLTMVTLYWLSETINSANRLYYERAHHPTPVQPDEGIDVPLGVALTTQRIERVPRESVERLFSTIQRWADLGAGGHFVAQERPDLVAHALREFFRPLRLLSVSE